MEITSSTKDGVAILQVGGSVDTRASVDFERQIVVLLEGGSRLFAIDLAKVELITSAGIRVLVMLSQRLQGVRGKAVLCAISEQVRTVFDVSGLTRQFFIAASLDDAIVQLRTTGTISDQTVNASKVSRLAGRLLGGSAASASAAQGARAPVDASARSELSSQVAQLLDHPRNRTRAKP